MKSLSGSLVLSFTLVAGGYSQSDLLHGTWKLDAVKSARPDGRPLPKQELLILEISDEAEQCTNDITDVDGHRSRSRYKATYNDGKWYRTMNLDTGEETGGKVMMLRFDERNELRVGQRANGEFSSMILRMVADDGKTMRVMVYGADGKTRQDLHFDKQ